MTRYYHGTDDFELGEKAYREGVQPRDILTGKKSKARFAPIHGRVYLTTSIGFAMIHVMGGIINPVQARDLSTRNPDRKRFGALLVFDDIMVPTDRWPDEDEVGAQLWRVLNNAHKKWKVKNPKEFEEYRKRGFAYDPHYFTGPVWSYAPREWQWLISLGKNTLTRNQLWILWQGEADMHAQAGKKLLKNMTKVQRDQFRNNPAADSGMGDTSGNLSVPGPIYAQELWRVDKHTGQHELVASRAPFGGLAEQVGARHVLAALQQIP